MLAHGVRILFSDIRIQLLALLVAFPISARASECGEPSPDYQAERIVTVGNNHDQMVVYVSGAMVREERATPDGLRVTLRDLQRGQTIVLDPRTGHSTVRSLPPRPPQSMITRTLNEVATDGSLVHVLQFQRGDAWLELSRTICRPDGIMKRQTFISLDPQGHEVEGTVTQDRIKVGTIPPDLFRLPHRPGPG